MQVQQYMLNLLTGGIGTMVLSAAARALPPPLPMGSRSYQFFYNFANQLLVNWDLNSKKATNLIKEP